MTLLEAILLGVLQGATEFLPVSSSGHLALAQHFLGVEEAQVAFDVALHVGTLLAVVWVYRSDLARLARGGWSEIASGRLLRSPSDSWRESDEVRLLGLLALGSVPTAAIGLLFQDRLEAAFDRPAVVATMLVLTGCILLLPRLRRRASTQDVRWWQAPLVGVAQGLAITPGISRSGATISLGLLLGVRAKEAARFSFLLSIPAILGALVLKAGDLAGAALPAHVVASGFVAAFAVGIVALRVLLALLERGRFAIFSIYCMALAAVTFVALGLA